MTYMIVEFISVLLAAGNEAAEQKLVDLGAIQRILDLFFEYPYDNVLHYHVENIIVKCLESKKFSLVEHVLIKCDLVTKIVGAEKNFTLEAGADKVLWCVECGESFKQNVVVTRLYLENNDWKEWYTSILFKRNAVENVNQWACRRPISFQDRTRDADDHEDRDHDVAALANNISQALGYVIYNNDDAEEARGTVEQDDEDVYFDDKSADVVVSSLRLGDDQESGSLLTNSNWFASENYRSANKEGSTNSSVSSPDPVGNNSTTESSHENTGENEDCVDTLTPSAEEGSKSRQSVTDKPLEWVQWRESSESNDPSFVLPNGGLELGSQDGDVNAADSSPAMLVHEGEATDRPTPVANTEDVISSKQSQSAESELESS